ncbi:hypothetical protein MVEN_01826900 [Mycena venus]|uniref:Uncharacterized protein n=1 Tax=Mycena venus TaxID=2733690 RepID=A0A8H6XLB8_9AGAR|nr:hypothetical protein MVEN_01826900 [Mycena venus]
MEWMSDSTCISVLPSLPMSSTEEILFSFGNILYRNAVPHSVGFAFYGHYLVVFFTYLWFTIQQPPKTRAAKFLFGAILLLCLSCTSQFVPDMIFSFEQIKGYFMWTDVPLADRRSRWMARLEPIFVLERWPTAVNFMISDLIVIWRASVTYQQRRWVQTLFSPLFSVLWICAASFTSRDAVQRSHNPTTDEQLNTSGNFILLGTNIFGTGAIAAKAWRQNTLMAKASIKWKGDVPRVMLLLIEAGAVWAVVQLLFSILQQLDPASFTPIDLAVAVIGKMAIYLAVILPTATMIII